MGTRALAGRSCASPAQLDLINLTIFAVGQNTRNVQLYAAADGTARLHQVTDQLTGSAGNISPIKKRKYITKKRGNISQFFFSPPIDKGECEISLMPIPTLNWGAQKGFVDQIVDVAKHASGSTRLKNAQSMCPAEWCSSSYVRKIALRHVQNLPMEKHTVDCKTFPTLCDCAQCAM